MTSGVYKITNKLNGKCYVGQSVNIEWRWRVHLWLNGNTLHLYNAIRKYGKENFEFTILEECDKDKELLTITEQKWMDKLHSEYNINPAANSSLGTHWAEGRKEHHAKLMKGNQFRKGKATSAATKEKLSYASKAMWQRPGMAEHFSTLMRGNQHAKGYKHTPERKAEISAEHKGIKFTEEHRARIAAANLGHAVSAETRKRISAARKKWLSKNKGAK